MTSTSQTAQANLAALRQTLQEMAASTKSLDLTNQERPVVVQGPVLVVKGK